MTKTKQQFIIKTALSGTSERPRVSVFRSNTATYAQIIDDIKGNTLLAKSTGDLKEKNLSPVEEARKLGLLIAEEAKKLKITEMVYDRNEIRYHGRIKALADGIREGGIKL